MKSLPLFMLVMSAGSLAQDAIPRGEDPAAPIDLIPELL